MTQLLNFYVETFADQVFLPLCTWNDADLSKLAPINRCGPHVS